jgi:trans-aconitate 2-methyltransferase
MSWDPKHYLSFADERTRPAAELISRIALVAPRRVIDLGCGPGNSTALLAARWPEASLDGLDSSSEMIASARESGVHADFLAADVATWRPSAPYDVILSNATLQWLEDHHLLLPRLMGFVASGGILAFQVPRNLDAPSHALMRAVAADGPWASKLRNVRGINVLSPDSYYEILAAHATGLDIWETEYLHVLEGDDPVYRWVGATGLRPYAQALAGEERERFLSAYRARLSEAYPKRADGKTLFPFKRLFVVAKT